MPRSPRHRTRDIKRGEPDTFGVYTSRGYLDTFNEVSGEIIAATIAVVSISLLVGGIGIMNVMLVSVSARTREIGLRKAVRAPPTAVMVQFLVEATVLSFTGGLLGLGTGALLTAITRKLPGAHLDLARIRLDAVMWSLAVAVGRGNRLWHVPGRQGRMHGPGEGATA
jgi:putative ABC transport system permease protein